MTKREKTLLRLLAIFLICAGGYYFVFLPFTEALAGLQTDVQSLETTFHEGNEKIANLSSQRETLAQTYETIDEIGSRYHVNLDQEYCISYLSDWIQRSGVEMQNISFSGTTPILRSVGEPAEGDNLLGYKMGFSVDYKANYEQVMFLLRLFETGPKRVVCTRLSISHKGGEDENSVVKKSDSQVGDEIVFSSQREVVELPEDVLNGMEDKELQKLLDFADQLQSGGPVEGMLELELYYLTAEEWAGSAEENLFQKDPIPAAGDSSPFTMVVP